MKVWKSYLDETENMAKQRVSVADKEQSDIAEKIKVVKTNKTATFKKVKFISLDAEIYLTLSFQSLISRYWAITFWSLAPQSNVVFAFEHS